MSEKFLWGGVVVVGFWIIESLCLPTEVFCDLYVTFMLLVKVTVKETGVSRETGCDNILKWVLENCGEIREIIAVTTV